MTDWNKPTTTSNYSTEFIPEVKNRDLSIAKLDYSADSNIPDDVVRYNDTSDKFQRYDLGTTSWSNLDFHTAIDNHIADSSLHQSVPTAAILPYGGASAPTGYLLCNGNAVSRTTYSALFAIVGTTFGSGDGSTTFNVPNLQQRFPLGKAASGTGATLGGTGGAIDHTHTGPSHTHTVAGHTHDMANHTHTAPSHSHTLNDHVHSVPAHYHDAQGSGADINITSSGSHDHSVSRGPTGGNSGSTRVGLSDGTSATATTTGAASHTHAHANVVGKVGNVSSANNGDSGFNSAGVSGGPGSTQAGGASATSTPSTNTTGSTGLTTDAGGTGATGTNNPPFLALNFIIKT